MSEAMFGGMSEFQDMFSVIDLFPLCIVPDKEDRVALVFVFVVSRVKLEL